ncbi:hypothetical protein PPERSA_03604 [Pseudocohnilembus persalinus]|uniref:AB hydrolase-1 domain-containing protein n=1 Tax=Pseudocohnilembus persalinus TaxID=266149 RepID=A0A0V0QDU5_PSEPJ|nr:hypothetical protein PPERSA_03604 [Pseudocohnilembus persalinus]|eukprot:KRX00383.1 hypothetical protein PPERSA_03604 [Pseudocohnilembus persalinus]
MNFDRNYLFYEDFKERSSLQIQKQRDEIQPIIEKNQKHFIQSESHHKNKQETQQKLKKLIFQDKSYIYYTDNLQENSNFEIGNQEKLAIFSVHACPGNHKDWQKLQNQIENNKIRWINFVVPGYDGEDERRGEYLGEFNQILEMMKKLIDFLQLEKIFLLQHSTGSIIGLLFQDKYPDLCLGHIMLGAVAINWTFGIKAYYEVIIGQFGEENQQKFIEKSNNDDDFRDKIFLQYQRNKKDQQFEHPGLGILKLADLDINQFWATFKIYANLN